MQNLGSYVVLFVGVLFANLLLSFGMILPDALNHYSDTIADNMLSNTQTMLQIPTAPWTNRKLNALLSMLQFRMETGYRGKQRRKVQRLQPVDPGHRRGGAAKKRERAAVQCRAGQPLRCSCRGWRLPVPRPTPTSTKTGRRGTITLGEKYEDTTYTFTVDGVYDYMGALAVLVPRES